ncbi:MULTISPECIES: hypothetical protein [unclassified Saccharopolyspora]|uniref:hypothetical protein n=1 Tax=Saccharopolyspora TaxID=1835 RepID=UPI00190CDC46|nr:hypothetical protein [Saccharopolyspora sp. HNM0986]MBK0868617.1 hypothetical protein [Saccharopolyspora sp. HNM0986]
MTGARDEDAQRRYRAFVRAHHPDAGGDPDEFAAGLAELRAQRDRALGRCPQLDRQAGAGARPDRYDAPVRVVAGPRPLRGVVHRIRAWHRRKRRTRVR